MMLTKGYYFHAHPCRLLLELKQYSVKLSMQKAYV